MSRPEDKPVVHFALPDGTVVCAGRHVDPTPYTRATYTPVVTCKRCRTTVEFREADEKDRRALDHTMEAW